jgi:hypothetical protein
VAAVGFKAVHGRAGERRRPRHARRPRGDGGDARVGPGRSDPPYVQGDAASRRTKLPKRSARRRLRDRIPRHDSRSQRVSTRCRRSGWRSTGSPVRIPRGEPPLRRRPAHGTRGEATAPGRLLPPGGLEQRCVGSATGRASATSMG